MRYTIAENGSSESKPKAIVLDLGDVQIVHPSNLMDVPKKKDDASSESFEEILKDVVMKTDGDCSIRIAFMLDFPKKSNLIYEYIDDEFLFDLKTYLQQHKLTEFKQIHLEIDKLDNKGLNTYLEKYNAKPETIKAFEQRFEVNDYYRIYLFIQFDQCNIKTSELEREIPDLFSTNLKQFMSKKGILIKMNELKDGQAIIRFPELILQYDSKDFKNDFNVFASTVSDECGRELLSKLQETDSFNITHLHPKTANMIIESLSKTPIIRNLDSQSEITMSEFGNIVKCFKDDDIQTRIVKNITRDIKIETLSDDYETVTAEDFSNPKD